MTIYIDNDYKCHTANDGTMREIETDAFADKCAAYIEGYRFVPEGEVWTREDGEVFIGTMISPWRNFELLEEIQAEYEALQAEIADMQSALNALYNGEV